MSEYTNSELISAKSTLEPFIRAWWESRYNISAQTQGRRALESIRSSLSPNVPMIDIINSVSDRIAYDWELYPKVNRKK